MHASPADSASASRKDHQRVAGAQVVRLLEHVSLPSGSEESVIQDGFFARVDATAPETCKTDAASSGSDFSAATQGKCVPNDPVFGQRHVDCRGSEGWLPTDIESFQELGFHLGAPCMRDPIVLGPCEGLLISVDIDTDLEKTGRSPGERHLRIQESLRLS